MFGNIKFGAKRADNILKQFSYISYCRECGYRKNGVYDKCENCNKKMQLIEKIYIGNFAEKCICDKIIEKFDYKIINVIKEEQNFPVYYDIHKICKLNHKTPKKMEFLMNKLNAKRTHFSETGIKTEESIQEILKIL